MHFYTSTKQWTRQYRALVPCPNHLIGVQVYTSAALHADNACNANMPQYKLIFACNNAQSNILFTTHNCEIKLHFMATNHHPLIPTYTPDSTRPIQTRCITSHVVVVVVWCTWRINHHVAVVSTCFRFGWMSEWKCCLRVKYYCICTNKQKKKEEGMYNYISVIMCFTRMQNSLVTVCVSAGQYAGKPVPPLRPLK